MDLCLEILLSMHSEACRLNVARRWWPLGRVSPEATEWRLYRSERQRESIMSGCTTVFETLSNFWLIQRLTCSVRRVRCAWANGLKAPRTLFGKDIVFCFGRLDMMAKVAPQGLILPSKTIAVTGRAGFVCRHAVSENGQL